MQFPAMFNLIQCTFRACEKVNCGPTGKAKGANQTTEGQACAMITCKFCDFEYSPGARTTKVAYFRS